MSLPLVSILMPVKNAATYLEECLNSIIAQSIIEWELIVIDDHSEDSSRSILRRYCSSDSRIKVHSNTGHGIIPALRLAHSHATGTYITRMDGDDIMLPDKLELMTNRLRSTGTNHVSVGLVQYFHDDTLGDGYQRYAAWLNGLTASGTNFNEIYKECTIPSPCWMVHRSDLDKAGAFTSDIYPEDYDLAFRFRQVGLEVAPVDQVLHLWRDHPNRTSRTDERYADNRFFSLKVDHFLDQDYNQELDVIVWGAGRKGKLVARLLLGRQVSFRWVSNNASKIGRDIYGVVIEEEVRLRDLACGQVIVVISGPGDSIQVDRYIHQIGHLEFYKFC